MMFAQICSYLQIVSRNFTNFRLPENVLVATANHCNVLKKFISMKVTVDMQSRRLRSEKIYGD